MGITKQQAEVARRKWNDIESTRKLLEMQAQERATRKAKRQKGAQ